MTVMTTDHGQWSPPVLDLVPPELAVGGALTDPTSAAEQPPVDQALVEHMRGLLDGSRRSLPDARARARIAAALFRTTHWSIFDDHDERAYVSRLWAEDWDCPEDAAYNDL
jgi:hypothetical protein